jgi:KaiC/GvpD/RAD55 family RecA-like ATPase
MSEMERVLNGIHEKSRALREEADVLFDFSRAFLLTGNREMARRLSDMGVRLSKHSDELHPLGGVLVSEYVKNADQASRNMLEAALAGIEIVGRTREGRGP